MRTLSQTLFAIVVTIACLPATAQKLSLVNNTKLQTEWRALMELKNEDGVLKARHRFGKDDKGYYFELAIFRHPGKRQPFAKKRKTAGIYFTPQDKIQFTLLMNKGVVTLPLRDTNMLRSINSDVDRGFIRFAATEAQLNELIQNKSVNISFTASGEKVEKEMNNEINFDIRSAASAILIQRDIRGEKLRVHPVTLKGVDFIQE